MINLKKIVVFLFFVCFTVSLSSQITKIRGKIFDADTKEPLPYVTIIYINTTIGTLSDENGEFYLETRTPKDSILIKSVGYRTNYIKINKGSYQYLDIELNSDTYDIEEVTIKPGENPAHTLLRKIVANKKNNSTWKLNAYNYEMYNKLEIDVNNISDKLQKRKILDQLNFVFENLDTSSLNGKVYLPVFITESVSDYYYQKEPKMEREVIKATKISGIENESVSQFLGKMYQKIDLYEDFISIFEQPGFVSPIASFGLLYYKYYIVDSLYIGDKWCYKVIFSPRRKQERTFSGHFIVNDTSFAIMKMHLRISKDVNLNFLNDMAADIEYSQIKDSVWFLTREEYFIDFNLTDKTTGFFGHKSTYYRNINADQPIDKNIIKSTDKIILAPDIIKDSNYWIQNRPFELSLREQNIYSMVDSIKQLPIYKTSYDIFNMLVAYYYVIGLFEIGPYYTLYSFNETEGDRFKISGRTSNDFSKKIMFSGYTAYGLKDNKFKYGLEALYMFNKNPRRCISASYDFDMKQLGKSENAYREDNIMSSMFRRNPNNKMNYVRNIGGYYEHEWGFGFSNKIRINNTVFSPTDIIPFRVPNDFDTSFSPAPNITTNEVTLVSRWAKDERFFYGEFERLSTGTDKPILNFIVTGGVNSFLDRQNPYLKIKFNISDKIFLSPFGFLQLRADAGKIFGRVPFPLLELHQGNETYSNDYFAFNMMNYYEFGSDMYASLNAEHHFQGLFLNRIPLLRKLQLREVVSWKSVIGTYNPQNAELMQFPKFSDSTVGLKSVEKPYMEASIGIENILKVFRLDAMWRLSHLEHPKTQKFGFRLKIQLIL